MQLAFVFGRLPALSRLEIESVATTLPFQWSLTSVQPNILRLKPEGDWSTWSLLNAGFQSKESQFLVEAIDQMQRVLGGTVKIVYLDKQHDQQNVLPEAQKLVKGLQEGVTGKRTIGLSVYSKKVNPLRLGMSLKKNLRSEGSVRVVIPGETGELSSAQILHNNLPLTEGLAGLEVNVLEEGNKFWVGVTLSSQDIESYSKRDFQIPKPDPISGMLPPKLAQTMINLAEKGKRLAVYDPFCGNGRIVMEAALMNLTSYGSDIVPKKVESATENMAWLGQEFGAKVLPEHQFWVADATKPEVFSLLHANALSAQYVLVGEPFLGKPLRAQLTPSEVDAWLADLLPLYEGFLNNWAPATVAKNVRPTRMLLVFPRAKVVDGTEAAVYEKLVDTIDRLGYDSKVHFTYDRPDSYVRRDLVSIEYRQ